MTIDPCPHSKRKQTSRPDLFDWHQKRKLLSNATVRAIAGRAHATLATAALIAELAFGGRDRLYTSGLPDHETALRRTTSDACAPIGIGYRERSEKEAAAPGVGPQNGGGNVSGYATALGAGRHGTWCSLSMTVVGEAAAADLPCESFGGAR
jgi:hypothetical protein